MKLPNTPLSTRFTGSAQTMRQRIRSIFLEPKRRPPAPALVLAALAIALCGGLVSCQSRSAVPVIVMDTQFYDIYENYIEIPMLALPDGAKPNDGIDAINRSLSDLKAEYQEILDASPERDFSSGTVGFQNHCLFYPSTTDRYLNLLFLRERFVTDLNSGHVLSLVYDLKEGRQVTLEDALALAGTTREELFAQLSAQYDPQLAQEYPRFPIRVQQPVLEGFRIRPDGSPVFYLTARVDDLWDGDPELDYLSGSENLYIWSGGTFTLYDQYAAPADLQPLVPPEETDRLDPPLWCQWFFAQEEPRGGFTFAHVNDPLAEKLARTAFEEDYDYLFNPELTTLFFYPKDGRTLLLVLVEGGPHPFGFGSLCLGVLDDASQDLVGQVYSMGGDQGLFSAWDGQDGYLYLLCSNSVTYQGDESSCGLSFFRFDGRELEQLYQLPDAARSSPLLNSLGPQALAMLYPCFEDSGNGDLSDEFWSTHKASPISGGVDLYEKNPDWDPYHPPQTGGSQWLYLGVLPFTGFYPGGAGEVPWLAQHRILTYLQQKYGAAQVHMDADILDWGQVGDLAVRNITCLGEAPLERCVGVAYQVEATLWQDASTRSKLNLVLILSRTDDGYFDQVLGEPAFPTDGMSGEEIVRQAAQAILP